MSLSIAPWWYTILGSLGIIVGALIKAGMEYSSVETEAKSSLGKYCARRWVSLLASVAIGFVALLALSRETIPTSGWAATVALGVAIAIFTDKDLLARIQKTVP